MKWHDLTSPLLLQDPCCWERKDGHAYPVRLSCFTPFGGLDDTVGTIYTHNYGALKVSESGVRLHFKTLARRNYYVDKLFQQIRATVGMTP
jgi:hypothetical protein